MKNLLIILFFSVSFYSFSQNASRVQLEEKDFKYLAEGLVTGLGDNTEKFQKSLMNNLTTYEFEIHYNDQVIYRGSINKPSYASFSSSMNKDKAAFCLAYDQFDADTKLELIESQKLKYTADDGGTKYFWTDNYKLFSIDYGNLIINDKIAEKIRIKFFKNIY